MPHYGDTVCSCAGALLGVALWPFLSRCHLACHAPAFPRVQTQTGTFQACQDLFAGSLACALLARLLSGASFRSRIRVFADGSIRDHYSLVAFVALFSGREQTQKVNPTEPFMTFAMAFWVVLRAVSARQERSGVLKRARLRSCRSHLVLAAGLAQAFSQGDGCSLGCPCALYAVPRSHHCRNSTLAAGVFRTFVQQRWEPVGAEASKPELQRPGP